MSHMRRPARGADARRCTSGSAGAAGHAGDSGTGIRDAGAAAGGRPRYEARRAHCGQAFMATEAMRRRETSTAEVRRHDFHPARQLLGIDPLMMSSDPLSAGRLAAGRSARSQASAATRRARRANEPAAVAAHRPRRRRGRGRTRRGDRCHRQQHGRPRCGPSARQPRSLGCTRHAGPLAAAGTIVAICPARRPSSSPSTAPSNPAPPTRFRHGSTDAQFVAFARRLIDERNARQHRIARHSHRRARPLLPVPAHPRRRRSRKYARRRHGHQLSAHGRQLVAQRRKVSAAGRDRSATRKRSTATTVG